jgi:YggT family protein
VSTFASVFSRLIGGVRLVFLAAAVVLAVVCLLDWLVRTRRLSPFSGVSRFMRRTVDPLLAPVERRVLRAGGNPQHVPWWALAAVMVGGIVLLSLLEFVGGQVVALGYAVQSGPRGVLVFAVAAIFAVLQIAIMVRVLASWIPSLSPHSPWIRWAFVISEPVLAPLRRIIPPIGMVDISPLIAYFAVGLIGGWVVDAIR